MAEGDGNSNNEVLDRTWTMGDERLLTSALQRMTFEEQAHSDHVQGENRDSFINSENGTDMFEQIQKIRKALSLDQAEEEMDGREEALEGQWAHCRGEAGSVGQADQDNPEMWQRAVIQEQADRGELQQQLTKDECSGNEHADDDASLGSSMQNSKSSKSTPETPVPTDWMRRSSINRTDAEKELDRLAHQVQFLVHQLTICQQNLVKAEREVSMVHDENRQLRSLIRDVQAALWAFDSDGKH